MRLLIVNPNATVSMTETIVAGARGALGPSARIAGLTNHDGPPAIEGAEDGAAAVPGVLALLAGARDCDAAVIACFDDTGLAEARAAFGFPVIGLGEAAFLAASLRGPRFSVVTTVPEAVPVIEANIAAAGLAPRCVRVRAAGVRVLDLERTPGPAVAAIGREIDRAFVEDGVASVVLGCAGMTALGARLSPGRRGAVIDCVRAAALMAAAAAGSLATPAGSLATPADG